MAYAKQTWTDWAGDPTLAPTTAKVNAARLNYLENGVAAVGDQIDLVGPVDFSTKQAGQFAGWANDGVTLVPLNAPGGGGGTTVAATDDLSDWNNSGVTLGSVPHWNTNTLDFETGLNIKGVIALQTGSTLPAGLPDCLVLNVDFGAVNTIKHHALDGTNGATVNAGTEGASSLFQTPTYSTAQHAVGTASMHINLGGNGYLIDSGLGLTHAYLHYWVRWVTGATGAVNNAEARTSSASLGTSQRIFASTFLCVKNGLGGTTGTGTHVTALDHWYLIEHHFGASAQELRLYDTNGTTLLDTITGSMTAGAIDTLRCGVTANLNAECYIDDIYISDGWRV